jgi:CRP-like cAMP-binding protein
MGTATASLHYDRLGRPTKVSAVVSPVTSPISSSPELVALQACSQLVGVSPASLQALAAASSLRTVARGAIVATEGAPSAHVVLVVRGRLRAVRRAANGREVTVEALVAGELLADAAFSPDGIVDSDWEAAESTTVLLLPREAWLSALRGAPDVALAVASRMLARLQRAKDLAVALALSDVEARVVAALIGLARQDGVDDPEGRLIRQRPTQQEIANQIGACRETVSRTVSDLARRGLITPRGKALLLARSLYTA